MEALGSPQWAPQWGAPHGGETPGGVFFFDRQKGCGGESLRRIFRLDFCIFLNLLLNQFSNKVAFSIFFAHFGPPGPGGHHGDLGPKETSRGVFLINPPPGLKN